MAKLWYVISLISLTTIRPLYPAVNSTESYLLDCELWPHHAHTNGLPCQPVYKIFFSVNNIETDPTAEISHFQIRLASLATILLHEDLLVKLADSDHILAPPSVHQMQQTVDHFFSSLGQVVITAYGNKDFENAKATFEKACRLNHLRYTMLLVIWQRKYIFLLF